MKRLTMLLVALAIVFGSATSSYAACTTHTYFIDGRYITCTTCCYGYGNCSTTCF